jgi:hypothetical protein
MDALLNNKTGGNIVIKLLVTFLILGGLACASPVITLTNPNQTGAPAGLLSFDVTIANPGGGSILFLNADATTVDSPLLLDDQFFLNSPLSLNSPESATFTLFTISIPGVIAPGLYNGSISIIGGVDASDQSLLGSVSFTVTVPTVSSAVPEPSTLIVAAPLLWWVVRKRRVAA